MEASAAFKVEEGQVVKQNPTNKAVPPLWYNSKVEALKHAITPQQIQTCAACINTFMALIYKIFLSLCREMDAD